jgi:hypothetical protein
VRYQPPFALPSEFALAVACCRWAYPRAGADEVRALAGVTEWPAFLQTCRRHRIQALARQSLAALDIRVDPAVDVALSGDARNIAEHGLRAVRACRELAHAFDDARIPLLFLKGLALGKLAYGDPFLKMGWDIDLLILPQDISGASAVLTGLGYRLEHPACQAGLARWHERHKESVWRNPDGLVVELHSRVADQPQLLPGLSAGSPIQVVEVAPGITLPTFADEELFAYLCVHGASSAWFRLKWIADLAALLHGRDSAEIARLHDCACQLGAGRAPGQALILASWLFAIPLDESLLARLRTGSSHWLARTALKEMQHGEPTERLLGTRNIHLTQFALLPGWRFKLAEFVRQLRAAADHRAMA